MNEGLNQELIKQLQGGMINEAFNQIKEFTEEDFKSFLKFLSDELKVSQNKAVINPNVATILKRKLKQGIKFTDFYNDWLPKITPTIINGRKIYDYFSYPTRVINCKPNTATDEFYSLALINSPYKNLEELFVNYKHAHNDTEESRTMVNQENLESSELVGYCEILSDDIFGV